MADFLQADGLPFHSVKEGWLHWKLSAIGKEILREIYGEFLENDPIAKLNYGRASSMVRVLVKKPRQSLQSSSMVAPGKGSS
jgi:hypothetical protein